MSMRGIVQLVLWSAALWTPMTATGDAQAQAQPSAAPADAAAQATARYEAGVLASKQGRWPAAYAAFRDAWRLKEHPQIAAGLGRAALNTGRPREAAERLAYFLREAGRLAPQHRKEVEDLLAEARKQVGTLTLSASRAGAELAVDGAPVGKAPIAREVFVDPGRRVIEARLPGLEPARVEVEVKAGSAQHVGLWLVELPCAPGATPGAAPAPAAIPAPAPAMPEAPQPAPEPSSESGEGSTSALVPSVAPLVGAPAPGPPEPLENSWARLRTAILGGGLTATAVTGVVGVTLALGSLGKASARDEQLGDQEAYARLEGERVAMANAAFWSFVAVGTLGAGTLGFALLAPKAGDERGVRVEARGTGMMVRGTW